MTRSTEILLWGATAALLATAWIVARRPLAASAGASQAIVGNSPAKISIGDPRLSAHTTAIVARNPFRLERRPSSVAYGGTPAASPANLARRPRFATSGITGPPWQAVLDGIPGREGSLVVRAGDMFGDFRVASVTRDTVVIRTTDTTWTLTVRRP